MYCKMYVPAEKNHTLSTNGIKPQCFIYEKGPTIVSKSVFSLKFNQDKCFGVTHLL